MKLYTISLFLVALSSNFFLASNSITEDILDDSNKSCLAGVENSTVDIHLSMKIIGTKNIRSNSFSFDLVGMEKDGEATFLTSGITKSLDYLIMELSLDPKYTKLGIKLKWDGQAKYFLFDRDKILEEQIDLERGKE